MLTAHLPSGYVFARTLPIGGRLILSAALAGAVLPDLDMIWFLFVDNGSIHHHRYWVHVPAFWLAVAAIVLPLMYFVDRRWLVAGCVFFFGLLMHLILDTISGGILWAAPFNDHLYAFVEVPATQSHWVLSFLLHWTFLLEIVIWAAAVLLWRNRSST